MFRRYSKTPEFGTILVSKRRTKEEETNVVSGGHDVDVEESRRRPSNSL